MRMGIATDHGGFGLKEELIAQLRAADHEVVDFGAHTLSLGDDHRDFVVPLARAVVARKADRGRAICGSGVGGGGVCQKGRGCPGLSDPRPFLGPARRRGRSHEQSLYGWTNRWTCGALGSRADVPGRRVQSSRAAPATPWQSDFPGGRKGIENRKSRQDSKVALKRDSAPRR
jgi:hypothetical protein